MVVGSKWGYTYTAGWQVDAPVHEVKDHSLGVYERQLGETRELLGDRLDLYQIHSLTIDSPALRDTALHRRLAELAGHGLDVYSYVHNPYEGHSPATVRRLQALLGQHMPLAPWPPGGETPGQLSLL